MDIQFFLFQDSLQVAGVQEVPDFVPRTLVISGREFLKTSEVRLNDVKSPSIIVSNNTHVLVQVPDSEVSQTIRSVEVLSTDWTASFRSKIDFKFGDNPTKASGLKALMQTFIKVLMQTPGSDAFNKTVGGGALAAIGRSITRHDNGILGDLAVAVARTTEQIRSFQSRQVRLPDDERLLSADLSDLKFDPATTSVFARIEILSQAGIRANANLEL